MASILAGRFKYVVLTRKIQVTIYLSGTLAKTKIYLNWYFPPQKWDGG